MGNNRTSLSTLWHELRFHSLIRLPSSYTNQTRIQHYLLFKNHLDELRRTDLVSDDRYYTTAEVAEKYGMSTANVGVIVKARNLTKVKVGVRNLLLKEEIDGVMAERMAQYGSYIIA